MSRYRITTINNGVTQILGEHILRETLGEQTWSDVKEDRLLPWIIAERIPEASGGNVLPWSTQQE